MDKKLALTILFRGADKLSPSLRKIVGLGEQGGQALGRLKREARDLGRQLRDVQGKLGVAPFNTNLIRQEAELRKALGSTNRELEKRAKFLAIDNRVNAMHARGDSLMSAGQSNMIGGAAMLAPFAIAGKLAVDYDKKLALIAQKTDLTKVQTQALGRELLRAARDARQLPATLIEGADFLAGKGLGAKELERMMPVIGRFATAWDADVIDASKAAYSSYSSLKIPLGQTARALEVMAAAGKAGGFEVKDMARFFPQLTGQLAALGSTGVSAVGDLSSALQVLEAQTGDGEQAATNLRNLLSFATSERGISQFQKFGIGVSAALKKAVAEGRSPIEELVSLTRKATGGDTMKIGELISNQQAAQAMTALIQRRDQYLQIRKQALAAQGLTDKEFARLAATSDANIRSLMGSLSSLGVTLGARLLPMLTQGANWLTRVTNKVADWADRNPALASTILSIVGAGAAMRVGLGALQFAFGGLLKPMASAWGLFAKWRAAGSIASAFPAAAKAFGLLRSAALVMAKGVMRAGLMMLANPMILAIVALVAVIGVAGYLIYKHWDTIKAAFDTGIATLGRAWDWLKGTFTKFPWLFGPLGLAVAFVTKNWDAISGAFSSGIATVKDFFSGLPGWMKTIGLQMMAGLVSALNPALLIAKLLSVARSGVTAFKDYFGIKSPSRLFMEMGGHLTEGLARGVEQGERRPVSAVTRMAAGVAGAVALGTSPAAAAPGGGNGGALAAGGVQIGKIEIHQQPGENADQLVKRVVDEIERRAAAVRRGSYRDHG